MHTKRECETGGRWATKLTLAQSENQGSYYKMYRNSRQGQEEGRLADTYHPMSRICADRTVFRYILYDLTLFSQRNF